MGITGKYDFPGIKKNGAQLLLSVVSTTPFGAWLMKVGLAPAMRVASEWAVNWLANKGLVFLNIQAASIIGEWQQDAFDKAFDEAIKKIELSGNSLTPEQIKEIDDGVIKAFDKFAMLTKEKKNKKSSPGPRSPT